MFLLVVLIVMVGITAMFFPFMDGSFQHEQFHARALVRNFAVYRQAVGEYALANPAFTGIILDASLNLPGPYQKMTNWQAQAVATGEVFVYGPVSQPRVIREAIEALDQQANIGVATSTQIVSPLYGNVLAKPAFVTAGDLVGFIGR
jgi:biotin carboxyl carrier protein